MRLRLAVIAAAVTAALAGIVLPAFAKSDSSLSGPGTVRAWHSFRLVVRVGDDAGVRPASARLQVRGPHGFGWDGPWRRLRGSGDPYQEFTTFTVPGHARGAETFRAIVSGGYAATNTMTIRIR